MRASAASKEYVSANLTTARDVNKQTSQKFRRDLI
jgi:hypothetical protein